MLWTKTTLFRTICRIVLCLFVFQSVYPTTWRVPWKLDLSFDTWPLNFGPTPAYGQSSDPNLAATPDANKDDPFIIQKAQELGNNPVQIFNFVRDEIGYESYKGSLRGARGTLWSKAGNALDQASLLIALLRASNIPARYVQGTLPDNLAQQLILSMFPAPLRVVGCLEPGTEISDPANDPKLLTETREHYWVQFDTGGGFQDADPTFANAQIGQPFISAGGIVSEIPDSLRHKVTVRLKRELTIPASGLLTGGDSQDVKTVLEETFITAAMVGRPLSIGNFSNTITLPSPAFSSITNTYSPYIAVSDKAIDTSQAEVIRGEDYQEVLTNFPFGSQILTGVFLEMEVSGPDGPTETFERTLLDRIGFDIRQNGGTPNLTFNPNGPPILTDFDIFTVNVLPGSDNPAPDMLISEQLAMDRQTLLAMQQSDGSFPSEALPLLRRFYIGLTRLHSDNFFALSDRLTAQIASDSLVRGYFDRPRLVIVSSQLKRQEGAQETRLTLAIDLRRDRMRAVAFPGQSPQVARSFNFARGIGESVTEHLAFFFDSAGGQQPQHFSTAGIFEAALAQEAQLAVIAEENLALLETLDISAEAKARITLATAQKNFVIVPTRSVSLNGVETVAWYEVNPSTGEAIGVTEDGGHQGLVEWAIDHPFLAALFAGAISGAIVDLPLLCKGNPTCDLLHQRAKNFLCGSAAIPAGGIGIVFLLNNFPQVKIPASALPFLLISLIFRNYSAWHLPNSEGGGFYCGWEEGIKGCPSKASRMASKTFLEFLRAVEI